MKVSNMRCKQQAEICITEQWEKKIFYLLQLKWHKNNVHMYPRHTQKKKKEKKRKKIAGVSIISTNFGTVEKLGFLCR